jgi:hypothetical protein
LTKIQGHDIQVANVEGSGVFERVLWRLFSFVLGLSLISVTIEFALLVLYRRE